MRKFSPWFRHHWRELLLALFILTPWVSLMVFGVLWLHDNQALLPWLAGTAALGLVVWPLRQAVRKRLRQQAREQIRMVRQPSPEWTTHSRGAWEKVELLASTAEPLTFKDVESVRSLAVQAIRLVAEHFHPGSARPEANITIPEVLLLAERVARDLRTAMLRNVPGSRSVKLGPLLAIGSVAGRYAEWAQSAYRLGNPAYDLYLLFSNTPAGVARIARGRSVDTTIEVGQQWLRSYGTRLIVLEVGRAAIDLYSGKLRLSDEELAEAAEADASAASRVTASPPRLLVAGQVNAGKSSLVNALAGGVLCEVRSTPVAAVGLEHMLTVEGEAAAIIVEATGLTTATDAQAATIEAARHSDMIVWVASATQPGHAADVVALTALRDILTADMGHQPPQILIALTHVDQLSPAAEWTPPYNTEEPASRKEKLMRRAMESVGNELGVKGDAIVPVAMRPGADAWNTEVLWGCIAARLDEAKRRKLQRLRLARGGWSWPEVAGQAANSIADIARSVLAR
jgi:predicted GTPase